MDPVTEMLLVCSLSMGAMLGLSGTRFGLLWYINVLAIDEKHFLTATNIASNQLIGVIIVPVAIALYRTRVVYYVKPASMRKHKEFKPPNPLAMTGSIFMIILGGALMVVNRHMHVEIGSGNMNFVFAAVIVCHIGLGSLALLSLDAALKHVKRV